MIQTLTKHANRIKQLIKLILSDFGRGAAPAALIATLIALAASPCFADNTYDGYTLNESAYQTPPSLPPTIAGLMAPGSAVGQSGYGYDSASGYTQGYQGLPPTCLAPIDINIGSGY